jgi:hypothetical protein
MKNILNYNNVDNKKLRDPSQRLETRSSSRLKRTH